MTTNTNMIQPSEVRKKKKVSLDSRKARSGWLFVMPFVVGILLIYIPIIIESIWLSFSSVVWSGESYDLAPVGFEFYQQALVGSYSKNYLQTLLSGVQQLVFDVPAIVIFSLFIAVVLNQKMWGRAAFRAIFFVPVIIATGLMESINLSDTLSSSMESTDSMGTETSATTEIVSAMDIEQLFANMKVGKELVMYITDLVNNIYNIVNRSGVQMLIFLAGLQSISPAIYEACQIEGATAWETFWKITFPMISPMILVNIIYTVIDSFTTKSNVVMSYINGVFQDGAHGVATAMSWIYFLMVMAIIGLVAFIASRFVFYQKRN